MALPGDMFSPQAARLRLRLHSGISNNRLLLLGHNFLLDSVVNNVINNITVPSFTSDSDTITTTTLVPGTTTEDYDETISNEIQVNNKVVPRPPCLLTESSVGNITGCDRGSWDNNSGTARPITAS